MHDASQMFYDGIMTQDDQMTYHELGPCAMSSTPLPKLPLTLI